MLVEDCHLAVVDEGGRNAESAAQLQDGSEFENVVGGVNRCIATDVQMVEVGSSRKADSSCIPCDGCCQSEKGMVGGGHVGKEGVVDATRSYEARCLESVTQFGTPGEVGLVAGIMIDRTFIEVAVKTAGKGVEIGTAEDALHEMAPCTVARAGMEGMLKAVVGP